MEIASNLRSRIQEAHERGRRGEVAGLGATLAAANAKLDTMRQPAQQRSQPTDLGMPRMRA
ncbi:hypothetical protein ACIBF6_41895 [Streptosporangium amethystogenes]|uniref:hypothetical protein n=1 Tax=Streptosporangium amethystogenes TaxID=2002 RepID=UPI003793F1CF